MLRCGDTLEAGEQRGNPVLNARRVLASVGDLTRWAVLCWAYRVAGRRQRRLIERLPETLAACVPIVPRLRGCLGRPCLDVSQMFVTNRTVHEHQGQCGIPMAPRRRHSGLKF